MCGRIGELSNTHTHIHAFSRYLKLTAGGVKQLTVRDRAREKEIKTGIDFLPSPNIHLLLVFITTPLSF